MSQEHYEIFGAEIVTYNMHGRMHLAQDDTWVHLAQEATLVNWTICQPFLLNIILSKLKKLKPH